MSNEKQIYGRLVQKHDLEVNWNKAINFIPKLGELIIYDVDETHELPRVKIGDGATPINDLPFTITQSDLAETDPTSAAYIKHSEGYGYFGETKEEKKEVITNANLTLNSKAISWALDGNGINEPHAFIPTEGKKYTISFNGEEYSAEAKKIQVEEYEILGAYYLIRFDGGSTDYPIEIGETGLWYSCFVEIGTSKMVEFTYKFFNEYAKKNVTFSIYEINEVKEIVPFSYEIMPKGYGGFAENITLLPETDLWFDDNFQAWGANNIAELMREGKEYTVTINGVEYTGVAMAHNLMGFDIVGFGNQIVVGGENTGEPFFAATGVMNGNSLFAIFDLTGATAVKASLVKNGEVVLFDERLIGDWVARYENKETDIVAEIAEYFDKQSTESLVTSTLHREGTNGFFIPEVGKKYMVYVDGVGYECEGKKRDNWPTPFVGNESYISPDLPDTGEPFLYVYSLTADDKTGDEPGAAGAFTIRTIGGTTVKFRVTTIEAVPVKMPEEYLPDVPVPTFDLTELGLDNLVVDGEISEMSINNPAIYSALEKGKVKFRLQVNSKYTVIDSSIAEYGKNLKGYQCAFFTTQSMLPESLIGIILDFDGDYWLSARAFTVNNTAPVDSVIINSSTESSNEKYRLTVDDDGIAYLTNVNESTSEKLVTETIMQSNIESYINEALLGGAW